jgi:hypothetical protein
MCTENQKSLTLKRKTFAPKGLRVTIMLYLKTGAFECQHTVRCLKLEKSGRRHRKSKLQRKPSQTQRTEADATTKNAWFCRESLAKTGCKTPNQQFILFLSKAYSVPAQFIYQ